jgi:hypothetical protein
MNPRAPAREKGEGAADFEFVATGEARLGERLCPLRASSIGNLRTTRTRARVGGGVYGARRVV